VAGKLIVISGPFEEADLLIFTLALRDVERRRPDRDFLLAIIDGETSLADARATVERIFPRIDGKEPVVETFPVPKG
jgi:hypothetical protein